MINKKIDRTSQDSDKIFDQRSMVTDYRTLPDKLRPGMHVLDVGCGTGSITRDIALAVGLGGHVTGIDNTEHFIHSGQKNYSASNLSLIVADIFSFNPDDKFDLIVAARTLQWLSNPLQALIKMKSMLKRDGIISILDYNHEAIVWDPAPPPSMRKFYDTFLKWRADAGMNNRIADELPALMEQAGLSDITVQNADEVYTNDQPDFATKLGIWSKVAQSRQMVEEGYIDDLLRLQAIENYNIWIATSAKMMILRLDDVTGRCGGKF